MKLRDCKHGILVIDIRNSRIGMIVGITNNVPSESRNVRSDIHNAIPLVQWSCGATYEIHQGNIEPYKGKL